MTSNVPEESATRPAKKNDELFADLDRTGELRLHVGPLAAFPASPRTCSFAHVRGMILGLAIGDALGNTTEAQLPERRRAKHGEIRDYLPNRHAERRPVGLPSDDTQMAAWTMEEMLRSGGLDPERLARRFAHEEIFGIGGSVNAFREAARRGGEWWHWAPSSAGNGALMRIAPVLIPHLRTGGGALWRDAALCARITHADGASVSSCVAFIHVLWDALDRAEPPGAGYWVERYLEVADAVEPQAAYEPRAHLPFRGRLADFVREHVRRALDEELSIVEAGRRWYSGAYLLETVPMVLLILERYGADPEEALVRAVNDTKDNDTIAAIVGAAVGALHGEDALPRRWVERLTGRTSREDDGKLFELLDRAESRWDRCSPSGASDGAVRVHPGSSLSNVADPSSRTLGCLLGGAVGDALGAPIEFLRLHQIRQRFGPDGIQDYAPAYGRIGAITDDTQMTLFTAEGVIRACFRSRDRGLCNPLSVIHQAYLRWLETQVGDPARLAGLDSEPGWLVTVPELHAQRAPGNTCLSALKSGRFGAVGHSLNDSKGCGGVMRAAPVGLAGTGYCLNSSGYDM